MSRPLVPLSIDFETASLVDLKKSGAWLYATDPSTRVLCMSYRFGNGPTRNWRTRQPFPQDVIEHVDAGGEVRAWHAGFEFLIWNFTLDRQMGWQGQFSLSLSQLHDTMASGAYHGLPLSLDMAGPAAGAQHHKNKAGHALMMRMCKPRSIDPVSQLPVWWHETDAQKFDDLVAYCDDDVNTESGIADLIPPLPVSERAVWNLDQRINHRGVGLDIDFVLKLKALAEQAAIRANTEIKRLTNGRVSSVNATAKLLKELQAVGYPHDNLRRGTVEQRLDEGTSCLMERELLELRADNARTSAAKLQAMLNASGARSGKGRVRGMLQYYGANRTGRWAGRLIQLQNMPRGSIPKSSLPGAIAAVIAGMNYDMIEALYGPMMSVVSSCLRACIVAADGQKLVSADLSQIEARVVAWLAGQQDILDVFARGDDVYTYTANQIGSADRQLGKVLVLACGFGMGSNKFMDTAALYGVKLSADEADHYVQLWRNNNSKIVDFWWACDRAARSCIAGGAPQTVGLVTFRMRGPNHEHMAIELPSGRELVYRNACLRNPLDGSGRTEICYHGLNQYTRRWEVLRTYGGKLVENIVQATARDIMAHSMLEADRLGIPLILTVHDELIAEPPQLVAQTTLDTLLRLMRTPPAWAAGLPVNAEGWIGDRYKK